MAQLYLLHEICTNKTFAVQMETYDTNHNLNKMREGKKNIIKITSYKHKCKRNSILLFFCAQLWPLMRCTTQSEWRFCSAYFGCCLCFFSVDYCIIDWMRCVCCCCCFFLLEREQPKSKKLISMTHILSVEILSCRILFSCIQNGAHEIQLRAACFDFERKYSCVCLCIIVYMYKFLCLICKKQSASNSMPLNHTNMHTKVALRQWKKQKMISFHLAATIFRCIYLIEKCL